MEEDLSDKKNKGKDQNIKNKNRSWSTSSGSSSSCSSSSSSSSTSGSSDCSSSSDSCNSSYSRSSSFDSSSSSSSSGSSLSLSSGSSSSSSSSSSGTSTGHAKEKAKQPRMKNGSKTEIKNCSPIKSIRDDEEKVKKAESKTQNSRKSRSGSPKRHKKERLPSPKPCHIYVAHLTQNVNKKHIQEIFSDFGTIKAVHLPLNRLNNFCIGYSYIEYSLPEEVEKAIKHMHGGQIDGHEISCAAVSHQVIRSLEGSLDMAKGGGSGERRRRRSPTPYYRRKSRFSRRF